MPSREAEALPGAGTSAGTRMVVDASVVVKWHLQDEEYVIPSLKLLDQFAAGHVDLLAPAQIRYEVSSAITVATCGGAPRLTADQGLEAIEEFLALGLTTISDNEVIHSAYGLVHQYDVAFYDALYLACAITLNCPLVTADYRFYQRIRTLPSALWIGDYGTTI